MGSTIFDTQVRFGIFEGQVQCNEIAIVGKGTEGGRKDAGPGHDPHHPLAKDKEDGFSK